MNVEMKRNVEKAPFNKRLLLYGKVKHSTKNDYYFGYRGGNFLGRDDYFFVDGGKEIHVIKWGEYND